MIKKLIKSGGHRARFHVTMLTNTAILDPLAKTAQPKTRQKGEIFRWCMWCRTEFDLTEHRFLPRFSHRKEVLCLLKSWNKKWGSPCSFLRYSCRKCSPNAFPTIFGLGRVSKWHVCGRGKKALKIPFLQNLHRDITVRKQCDKDGA